MVRNISVIIVTYHTGPILFDCLAAVAQCPEIGQIIVVDNGNDSATKEKLGKISFTGIRFDYIEAGRNLGFGKACNLGAKSAAFEKLVFLNPDAIVENDAIGELTLRLDDSPQIIGGLIIDENGKEQRGARRGKLSILSAVISFSGQSKIGEEYGIWRDFNWWREPLPTSPIEVHAISGAFFAIKASDFKQIGGFDEGYFLHVEDIDICQRLTQIGGKIIFNPKARARHIGATSKAPKLKIEWHKYCGLLRFFWRTNHWLGRLALIFIAPLLGLALFIRTIR